jgi:hypothetical protein
MRAVTARLDSVSAPLRDSSLSQWRAVEWVLHKNPNYLIIWLQTGKSRGIGRVPIGNSLTF